MKKRFLSMLLSIVMVIGLLPMSVFAEEGDHTHDDGETYAAWTAASGNLVSGNYYLSESNATALTERIIIHANNTVTLCLNGNTLKFSGAECIVNQGTLVICDCAGNGGITASNNCFNNVGTLTVTGGTITNDGTGSGEYGIFNNQGTLFFNGGTVQGPYGIYNTTGTCDVSGGHVVGTKNRGIHNYSGTLAVSGGTITCTSMYGIYNGIAGILTVSDGTIQGGSAGIYNYNKCVVTGGTIQGDANKYLASGINTVGPLFLTGSPTISGKEGALRLNTGGTVYATANEDGTGEKYTGSRLSIYFDKPEDWQGKVIVYNATPEQFAHAGSQYVLLQGSDENANHLILTTPPAHTHVWDDEWTIVGDYHWHACTADDCDVTVNSQKDGYGTHTPKNADEDCTTAETCECGYEIKAAEAEHDFSGAYQSDANGHWHKCANCDETDTKFDHAFSVLQTDKTHHWNKCEKCDATDTKAVHTGGTATCATQAECEVCKTAYGELNTANHAWGTPTYTWSADNSTCTAERVCSHNQAHKETETANSSSQITQSQTCILPELTTYTASFNNVAFAMQEKTDVETKSIKGHSYTLSTDGKTITQTCENGCGHSAAATINAPTGGLTYNGTTEFNATITYDGDAWVGAQPQITYGTGTPADHKNAGEYTATMTVDGITASVSYVVTQKDITGATITLGATLTYTGEEQTQTVASVTIDGLEATYTISGNRATDVGNYALTVTGNGNFTGTQTMTWSITNATFSVTASGYDGVYDGKAHTISVTADGATITYSTDGTSYSATKPEFTNAGTYTVYYKAVKANHSDVTGSATVKISKATPVLTITPSDTSLWGGGRVTFKVTGAPAEGNYIITSDPAITANNDGSFTLPNRTQTYVFTATYAESTNYTTATANCTVSTTFFMSIPAPRYYELSFDTNGGTDISSIRKVSGTTIDLTDYVPTREGYIFEGWYSDVRLTDEITSVRLTRNTTVYAGWTKIEEQKPVDPIVPIVNPFKDIYETDWYYDDVMYVYEKDLMKGPGNGMFSPSMTTTRGMIVTILYRLEGEPNVTYTGELWDVPSNMYYAPAVEWAAAYGILNGYGNGLFGPDDPITREQMAAILWRYAQYKGIDVSVGEDTNILSYNDAFDISEYAIPAMQWVCGEGIIGGKPGGILDPTGMAQRCQVAAILHRFCELIEK